MVRIDGEGGGGNFSDETTLRKKAIARWAKQLPERIFLCFLNKKGSKVWLIDKKVFTLHSDLRRILKSAPDKDATGVRYETAMPVAFP